MKEPSLIYLDNASTTLKKPPEVARAVANAIDSFGSVGRGACAPSLKAGMAVYEAREKAAHLFGAPSSSQVAFTLNATEALNMVIDGLLGPQDHAITTAASHNSVLRPLYKKQDTGTQLSILPVAPDGSINLDELEALFKPQTKLVVVTHASNVTGQLYPVERIARLCHQRGVMLVLDAAQTAGHLPINMTQSGIDVLVFTGHKGLLGPQGVGGLCLAQHVEIPAYMVGGSGTHSFDHHHPSALPEHLEAGTMNAHSIAGFSAALDFIQSTGLANIQATERALAQRFLQGLNTIDGVTVYGQPPALIPAAASATPVLAEPPEPPAAPATPDASDPPNPPNPPNNLGIIALNVHNLDSAQVAYILSANYSICTRSGVHCAPLMHQSLGTAQQGAVRFSLSLFNTPQEIDTALEALTDIARHHHPAKERP